MTIPEDRVLHTCNGPGGRPMAFGRRAPEGECARCDELRAGAEPRPGWYDAHSLRPQQATTAEIEQHGKTCAACRTGAVCTAFDW